MNLNEHPDERYILEMERRAAVIDNNLFDSVWQTYRAMTHAALQPVKKCPVCAASSGGWRLSWRIRDPGPRPPGVVRSGHQHHRCDTASLAGESLSPATLRHCRYSPLTVSHSEVSLSRPDSALRPVPVIKSVFCFLHNISLRCGNSKLMCCFVLRDPLMTLLYQLMKEEVMEI